VKFGIGDFYDNVSGKFKLIKIGAKYRTLYMETYLDFIVVGVTKSP